LKNSSPPINEAVKVATRGNERAVPAKRARGRQMTSPHAPADAGSSPSRTRRKVAEIRRDARDAKVDHRTSLPPSSEPESSGREHDGEIEVVRTEPCGSVLRAQVMAAARHGESTWVWEGWSPGHEDGCPQIQDEPYGHMAWGPSSIPLELPYCLQNPPSQLHPEVLPDRLRTIEGRLSHSARPQSPVHRPPRPRPQSLQMPYSPSPRSPLSVTHSAPSTVSPPPSAISTGFTPPRPSIPARSMSWTQYSTVPFTERVARAYATSPGPPIQLLQAPGQQGYFVHYPDSNRTSDARNHPLYISIPNPSPKSTVNKHVRRTQRNPCATSRHSNLVGCT